MYICQQFLSVRPVMSRCHCTMYICQQFLSVRPVMSRCHGATYICRQFLSVRPVMSRCRFSCISVDSSFICVLPCRAVTVPCISVDSSFLCVLSCRAVTVPCIPVDSSFLCVLSCRAVTVPYISVDSCVLCVLSVALSLYHVHLLTVPFWASCRAALSLYHECNLLTVPFWASCRVALSITLMFNMAMLYLIRVNLSVAILCMVKEPSLTNGNVSMANTSSLYGYSSLNETADTSLHVRLTGKYID